jgi:hypothetical protein
MLTLSPATVAMIAKYAGYAGFVLWTVAYICFICRAWKDKTYGVPLISVCLNFTWELYFAVLCRPGFLRLLAFLDLPLIEGPRADLCTATGGELWGLRIWLLLDTVILLQLLAHGSRGEPSLLRYLPARARARIFYVFLYVVLLIALYWQYAFVNLFTDRDGTSLAWLTNYIMSWLFVSSAFFRRPAGRGLSLTGGLAMLLGNCAFAAKAVLSNFAELTAWPRQFTTALMFGVILVNVFYLYVLWYKTRGAEEPMTATNVFTPATT